MREALPPGPVHFAGIGGVGMAGLALLLSRRGWRVSGCDAYGGPLLEWLREKGIPAVAGHSPAHLESGASWIVRSPAVPHGEPEIAEAVRRQIPVFARGVVLPELLKQYTSAAVAGTHGKTTTSSMLSWILSSSGTRTTYCIGGVCPNLGAVAHAEPDGYAVAEADESDGTLQFYSPDIGIITNMDLDHVDYFKTATMQEQVYAQFASQSRAVIYSAADLAATKIARSHAHAISFGLASGADISAKDMVLTADRCEFTLVARGQPLGRITLPVPGEHNILNALAAASAAIEWGISFAHIAGALSAFQLPRRRFDVVAEGSGLRVISDYAHHPVEIESLLRQARLAKPNRIIGVFQPHRFSRTLAFKKSFAEILGQLDYLVLAPVYAASEPRIAGGTSDDLYAEFAGLGNGKVRLAAHLPEAWQFLRGEARSGDLVLVIGAGDVELIGTWAAEAWGSPGKTL